MSPLPYPSRTTTIVKTGIYSIIRHPIYSSLILLFTGYTIYWPAYFSLILCVCLIYFFVQKVKVEEQYLKEKFNDYGDYCLKTKKLFPFIY